MTGARQGRTARMMGSAPPEFLFVLSGAAQYAGAVVAINLFDESDPVTIAWIRVLSAGVILTALSSRTTRRTWTRHELAWAGLFGTATALMNTFFYLAVDRMPLGKGVAIEFIGPITVAALRTRSLRNSGALLLAGAGVVVLGGVELGNDPMGLVWILLASLMWAGYIVLGSRVALGDRGMTGLGTGLLVGSLVLAPFGVPGAIGEFSTPHVLLLAATVGMLSSAIGYGIDQMTMRRIPVRRFSLMLALLPVTAALFGFLFLGQSPTVVDLAGMALVLAGVTLQERETIERHRPEPATT